MYEPVAEDLADDDELGAGLGDRRNALPGHPTPVRVLLRGLELMQALSRHGPLTTASLSQKLRLARTTVNRCLATLEGTGFVERLPNRRYALTAKAVTLSHGFDAATERLEVVRAAMHASSSRVQWPMSLMRLHFPVPVLATASGRAVVAFSSPRVRDSLLEHLWPNRPADSSITWVDRAAFDREMAQTRERGYARCVRPLRLTEQGSFAVPVMVDGEPVAAIAVRFALSAVSFEDARKRFLPALFDIALGKTAH
ncbi:MAG: MarR family transcriptional regulator [Gammaproteobacteria bacterium]|nr:MarR family transcriptional regulator [Gammaproteobacteria bacterium]